MLLACDTGVPTSVAGGLIAGANIYASARAFAGGAENLLVYRDEIRAHADVLADGEVITPDQHTSVLACLTDEATAAQFEEWGNGDTGVPCDPERSEEHTSELQSLMRISYAVFCLKQKNYNI